MIYSRRDAVRIPTQAPFSSTTYHKFSQDKVYTRGSSEPFSLYFFHSARTWKLKEEKVKKSLYFEIRVDSIRQRTALWLVSTLYGFTWPWARVNLNHLKICLKPIKTYQKIEMNSDLVSCPSALADISLRWSW